MAEWSAVEALSVLIGLFVSVGLPIIKLISSITKLTVTVESIQRDFESVTTRNTESHRRMWVKLEEHDRDIADHDGRIRELEGRVDAYHGQ